MVGEITWQRITRNYTPKRSTVCSKYLIMIGIGSGNGNGKDRAKIRNAYRILFREPELRNLVLLRDNIKIRIRGLDCKLSTGFN
jgi:hypothetical protein